MLGGQGTPSALSPTPSPAGSVGSVGSQSSGYSSGELVRGNGNGNAQVQTPSSTYAAATVPNSGVLVPLHVYTAMIKQNQFLSHELAYEDLWDQADSLILKDRQHKGRYPPKPSPTTISRRRMNVSDFFINLDRKYKPLTLHSSLTDLVKYVRAGIQKLKEESN